MLNLAKSDPSRTRRSGLSLTICLAALLLCTLADLGSKDWALGRLSRAPLSPAGAVCVANDAGQPYFQRIPEAPIVLINDYLELRYTENCGAAFGVLNRSPSWLRLFLFAPAAIAASIGLVWLYATGYGGRLFAVSVPLIASGAIGNLVDRFRLGYVVDFVRFHVKDAFVYPTFNIADVTITVGVALLLLEGFIAPRTSQAPTLATGEAAQAKTPR